MRVEDFSALMQLAFEEGPMQKVLAFVPQVIMIDLFCPSAASTHIGQVSWETLPIIVSGIHPKV